MSLKIIRRREQSLSSAHEIRPCLNSQYIKNINMACNISGLFDSSDNLRLLRSTTLINLTKRLILDPRI